MKLYTWPTSPFGAKVKAVAKAVHLYDELDIISMHPWEIDSHLVQLNPLGKIPILLLENGLILYDSPVICEYLDDLSEYESLFPKEEPNRWLALRQQAEADGLMDAAVLARYETHFRPEYLQSQDWLHRQLRVINRTLDHFNRSSSDWDHSLTIGTITIATCLSYLTLRYPALNWSEGREHLRSWYEKMLNFSCISETIPEDILPLPEKIDGIQK
jgi:glutathione S-transferase